MVFFCKGPDVIIKKIQANEKGYTRAYLDLYPLTPKQVGDLGIALEKNTYLKYLNLFDCRLNKSELQTVLTGLEKNKSIEKVVINHDIGADLHKKFMSAVQTNQHEQEDDSQQFKTDV